MSQHSLSISGESIGFDGQATTLRGLRLSNALLDDRQTDAAIGLLPTYRAYGVNSFSVFVQGNRFGDVVGYREDGSLDPDHAARLQRLLAEADQQAMMVVVGCLYWGHSRAKWDSWRQADAERAVAATARWLGEQDAAHVFLDPDNEGMAHAQAGFDNEALIAAAKAVNPRLLVAINNRPQQPAIADLHVHFSPPVAGKPWVETEGSPPSSPYWGPWSKPYPEEWYQYDHIGEYTAEMRRDQLAHTMTCREQHQGYFFASTGLQAAPPLGPNWQPGGAGTKNDPGMRWWLEALRERYGSYGDP